MRLSPLLRLAVVLALVPGIASVNIFGGVRRLFFSGSGRAREQLASDVEDSTSLQSAHATPSRYGGVYRSPAHQGGFDVPSGSAWHQQVPEASSSTGYRAGQVLANWQHIAQQRRLGMTRAQNDYLNQLAQMDQYERQALQSFAKGQGNKMLTKQNLQLWRKARRSMEQINRKMTPNEHAGLNWISDKVPALTQIDVDLKEFDTKVQAMAKEPENIDIWNDIIQLSAQTAEAFEASGSHIDGLRELASNKKFLPDDFRKGSLSAIAEQYQNALNKLFASREDLVTRARWLDPIHPPKDIQYQPSHYREDYQ